MEGYDKLTQKRQELDVQRKLKYKNDSKERLKKIARKKIQTTMIGALDSIEKHFGFLWEEDEEGRNSGLRDTYELVRQEILDRGNEQMRNLDHELNQYDIEWLRYQLTIPVKKRI
jgi:transcription termination factor Rho